MQTQSPGRRLSHAGVAVTALGLLALPADAAEIEMRSRIEAVTVYADGALVRRIADVDLPAGSSLVILRGLPLSIDPASLRVEGQGDAQLILGSVDARLAPGDPSRADSAGEIQLRALRLERGRIATDIETAEGRRDMIKRFGQSGPDQSGDTGKGLDIEKWAAAWDAVSTALGRVNEDLRKLRINLEETDEKIRALEAAENLRRSKVAPEREFVLSLETPRPVKGNLVLSYRVTGASWRPTYDAHLETAAGKPAGLRLTRRAMVSQRTGENWNDVALTLSTVRQRRGTAAPELPPEQVAFFEPPQVIIGAGRARTMAVEADRLAASQKNEAPAPQPLREQQAVLESNGYEANWRIAGVASVPADGSQKSLAIQSSTLAPDLLVRSAPSLDTTAYLEAEFVNSDEAPLLAGEVTLLRDRAFVGRGRLAFSPPGEKVRLGFGADEAVRISRVPVRRRETEPSLIGSTKTDTREFRTVVRNLHAFPVRAMIQDRIPYSESANITVDLLSVTTPPTEKMVQDRRGVMGWAVDLKPGEEREIRLAYRVRWPVDRELSYVPQPLPR